MLRLLPSLIASYGLLLAFPGELPAWQCLCVERQSLTQQRDQSDALLLVQFISAIPSNEAAGFAGRTTCEIVDTAWEVRGRLHHGETISIDTHIKASRGDLYLVIGTLRPQVNWHFHRPCSIDGFDYLRRAPPLLADPTKRLLYYLRFLEHPDLLIADDTALEVSRASLRDLTPLVPAMRPDLLRKWVASPDLPGDRIGVYGLLLGLCGGPEDAEVLKQVILRPTDEFRLGIDYVVAGYLLLSGAQGLDVLDEAKLRNTQAPFSETYAVMQAMRFLNRESPERIARERLCASMRLILDRSDFADLVIADLARWEDWSVTDRLMELYNDPNANPPAVRRAIARFYLYQRQVNLTSNEPDAAEYVRSADQHLAELRRIDPKTVQLAERFHFVQ